MPLMVSTRRPAQSQPWPYCQRVPGSNISGPTSPGPAFGGVPEHLLVPGVIAEARGMGEQVFERDRCSGRSEDGFARGIEACELRQMLRDRFLQRDLALLD